MSWERSWRHRKVGGHLYRRGGPCPGWAGAGNGKGSKLRDRRKEMDRLGNLSRWEVREKNPLPVVGLVLPWVGDVVKRSREDFLRVGRTLELDLPDRCF